MTANREDLLLAKVSQGINEAWNYHPLSHRASELQEVFRECKEAMTDLAQMGSEKGIDKIAYICRECIRDGFGSSTGIRAHASKTLAACNHPLAIFHRALDSENLTEVCVIVGQSLSLKTKLLELSAKEDDLDPYESPNSLLRQTRFAARVLRVMDNKEELEKLLRGREQSLQEPEGYKFREAERKKSEEAHPGQKEIELDRIKNSLCIYCGNNLSRFDRIFGRLHHKHCSADVSRMKETVVTKESNIKSQTARNTLQAGNSVKSDEAPRLMNGNELGKRYVCSICGTHGMCIKAGKGSMECCDKPMVTSKQSR